jgi:hypothetical protein
MRQKQLLLSLSTVALAASFAAGACHAKATTPPAAILGGGAQAEEGVYAGPNGELSTYNAGQTAVAFSTYWAAGSGTGQKALINNDLTCDINKVIYSTGTSAQQACSNDPPGTSNYVDYAVSETALSAAQEASWQSATYGQAVAGNLIQIPLHGAAVAIVPVDTNITSNGALELSDNDLCEIFSGGYTDFSQIKDSKTLTPTPGAIQLVYRSDSSGGTFILTQHLAAVCNASNTAPGVTFTATSTFATLFPTASGGISHFIPNSVGESGFLNLANYLSNLTGTTVTQAIGYLTPDWTSLPPAPDSYLSNGKTSSLFVASIFNGKTAYTPTQANIIKSLKTVTQSANGSPTTPPSTAAQGANPLAWVPIPQIESSGYPIVGYGTIDVPQCFANSTVAKAFVKYLTLHYTNATYEAIQTNNGVARIINTGASKFYTTVADHILKNTAAQNGPWNTNIGNTTVCGGTSGYPGR